MRQSLALTSKLIEFGYTDIESRKMLQNIIVWLNKVMAFVSLLLLGTAILFQDNPNTKKSDFIKILFIMGSPLLAWLLVHGLFMFVSDESYKNKINISLFVVNVVFIVAFYFSLKTKS